MMTRVLVSIAFFVSIVALPWFVSVPLGVLIIALWGASVEAVIGGIMLDSMFGAPIQALAGFPFLYTTLFLVLALGAFVMRRLMIE